MKGYPTFPKHKQLTVHTTAHQLPLLTASLQTQSLSQLTHDPLLLLSQHELLHLNRLHCFDIQTPSGGKEIHAVHEG